MIFREFRLVKSKLAKYQPRVMENKGFVFLSSDPVFWTGLFEKWEF